MSYQRRICRFAVIIFSLVFLFSTLLACDTTKANKQTNSVKITTASAIVNTETFVEGRLEIHFLNVGQADCTLIKLPDGKNILIDCGKSETPFSQIKDYLKAEDVETIHYLIVTHPDLDHYGYCIDVLNNFTVEKAYIPYVEDALSVSIEYDLLISKIKQDCQFDYSAMNKKINGEEYDYKLTFLSPSSPFIVGGEYDLFNNSEVKNEEYSNNISAVILLDYQGKTALFTGDTSSKIEEKILDKFASNAYKNNVNLSKVNILKLAHHGSSDSNNKTFLEMINPDIAVISVGVNSYGFPSQTVLDNLTSLGTNLKVFRTDENGNIVINIDKNSAITYALGN